MKSILNRIVTLAFAGIFVSASLTADAAEISEVSAEEFYGAVYFRSALEHPQVAKQKNRKKQIRLVARDIRWKTKRLTKAIEKVESLSGDPVELAKQAVKAALEKTRVKGRVLDILVNAEEPKHVVMYIRWRGSHRKDAIKEASTIALTVGQAAPLVSTLSLAAIHPKAAATSTKAVWQGKIAGSAMGNIRESRIEDYADRLYARLFEDVKALPF